MDAELDAHPAVTLLLLTGLIQFWAMPAVAWALLKTQRDKPATLWFAGTACYACSVTIFVFQAGTSNFPTLLIALSLVTLMLCLMFESLRQEFAPGSTPWLWIVCFVCGNAVLLFLLRVEYGDHVMRVVQLGVISVCDLVCCVLIAIIAHKQRSRALFFVLIAFFVAAVSNAFRIYSFLVFAEPPNLLNYSKASNIGFIVNYLSVVLYSFGYWGFVIEKQRSSLAQEMAKRRNAELGELEAKDREVITLKYLKHSDELVEIVSRLHKAVQSGALSASIAHEISQPLTTIRLAAEEACDALQKGVNRGRVEELLEVIVREGRRAGNIIRTLRNLFAGSRAPQEQRTLDEILLAVCRITERQLKRISATLKIELRAPVQVRLGVGEIEQVVLNLLTNAIDAVSRSGESSREIALFSWIDGEYAYVRVVDTGPGVPVDLSEKIFEIFSSDRPDGLGLGLWLSRFIVERYDGQVLLERREGKPETSFLVKLPVSRNPSS